jgi:hypothetical protein
MQVGVTERRRYEDASPVGVALHHLADEDRVNDIFGPDPLFVSLSQGMLGDPKLGSAGKNILTIG